MRMTIEVVSCMTLATVARCCYRGIRCRVMTGGTAVMFLGVQRIDKVNVVYRLGMTAAAFSLQCHFRCMVLCRMGTKVAYHSSMTL